MAVKKRNLGSVIARVGGFHIRQVQEFSGREKERKVSNTVIGIYRGKNLVENGFKNKETAVSRASKLR